MQNLFLKNYAADLRILIFTLLSGSIMFMDYERDYLNFVRTTLGHVIYPLQYLVDLPFSGIAHLKEITETRHLLLDENATLKRQHLLYQQKLQLLANMEAENERLRKLLNVSMHVAQPALLAELLSIELSHARQQLVINKGEYHAVATGQAVLDAYGIMGQIMHITAFSSTVLLITDAKHSLPVKINRTGYRALASGTGEYDKLTLNSIPNNVDLKIDDLVVSSGLGERFPKGYPVGVITEIIRNPNEPFAKINITPNAQFKNSNEVLVIAPKKNRADNP